MEKVIELVTVINSKIHGLVWGTPMLVLILGTGIYMSIRTGFFQLARVKLVFHQTLFAIFKKKSVTRTKDKKSITQFQALSTALAATIGTGNIAGVATAISMGGPGAVFWMWVSAFFGMMTSYAENVLGIYFRRKNAKGEWSGGPMYYLEHGVGSKTLAVLFAVFCALASFGIGNMTQVNSISSALHESFGVPVLITGVVLAVFVALIVVGGIKRIGQTTEKLVPFMALVYIIGAVVIIMLNIQAVPGVFKMIFQDAFGLNAVAGGISGAAIKHTVTMGLKRGVFSNEAGLGSAVMVNSASNVKEPAVQGMWGILEVFIDTIVVCTLTALVILSTNVVGTLGASGIPLEGVPLVSAAFSHGFGSLAGKFVSIAILLFAFSTVLGWSYYGEKAVEYLLGSRAVIGYKILFVLMIVVGATMNLNLVWSIADTLNGLMAIPNLIGVLLLSGLVLKITNNYIGRHLKGKNERPALSAEPEIQRMQETAVAEEEAGTI